MISVVTTLSVAALPFIQQAAEKLGDRMDIKDENRDEIIKTTLAVSYPFGQLGNFFIWLFVLFGAFYYRVPMGGDDQLALPFVSLLSGIGSPSSSVDAVAFLTNWLGFPSHATGSYVGMMALTRYGQVVASVMGFAFITFLVTLNYYGKLQIRVPRLVLSLLVSLVIVVAVTGTGRFIQSEVVDQGRSPYLTFEMASDVTEGVIALVEKPGDPAQTSEGAPSSTDMSHRSTPSRIQSTGEWRVGYNPDVVPFSYLNSKGQLIGFDIARAYRLARDLNVNLRLIPFEWQSLEQDLLDDRFDLAASGIYVSDQRLQRLAISEPHYQSPVALIVRAEIADRFLSRAFIEAQTDLVIGVFNDPIPRPLAKRLFPHAKIEVVPSYQVLPERPDIDAAIWTLEQAKAWAAPQPDYTAVVPKDLGGRFLFAYLMPADAVEFQQFVNYWMRLQDANGSRQRLVRQWIDGKPEDKQTPRWSILGNLLGWESS